MVTDALKLGDGVYEYRFRCGQTCWRVVVNHRFVRECQTHEEATAWQETHTRRTAAAEIAGDAAALGGRETR